MTDLLSIGILPLVLTLAAFLLGLLPFAALVGKIYTILGYIGLLFAGCVIYKRIRRITGYLVGTMDHWNDAKTAEEADRVKHSLGDEKMETLS